jgi:hypothetical protein
MICPDRHLSQNGQRNWRRSAWFFVRINAHDSGYAWLPDLDVRVRLHSWGRQREAKSIGLVARFVHRILQRLSPLLPKSTRHSLQYMYSWNFLNLICAAWRQDPVPPSPRKRTTFYWVKTPLYAHILIPLCRHLARISVPSIVLIHSSSQICFCLLRHHLAFLTIFHWALLSKGMYLIAHNLTIFVNKQSIDALQRLPCCLWVEAPQDDGID